MKRIGIIAQSQVVLQTLDRQLRQLRGVTVVAALDGRTPLAAILSATESDLVLIDGLPTETVVSNIRAAAASTPNAMIVVLTSSRGSEWLDQLFDAGADVLLARSLDPVKLGQLVGQLAGGAIVHSGGPRRQPAGNGSLATLTTRELEILRFVAQGRRNQQIAEALSVTPQTIKFHLTNVYRKLDVRSRTEASRFAHVHGIVDEPAADRPPLHAVA